MTAAFWQIGSVVVFAWITYTTGQSVVSHVPDLEGSTKKFHDRLLRPFGAVLTFVFAGFTVSSLIELFQLALR
jgi:hypothetical protein